MLPVVQPTLLDHLSGPGLATGLLCCQAAARPSCRFSPCFTIVSSCPAVCPKQRPSPLRMEGILKKGMFWGQLGQLSSCLCSLRPAPYLLYNEKQRPFCQKYHLKYCYNGNIEKHYVLSPRICEIWTGQRRQNSDLTVKRPCGAGPAVCLLFRVRGRLLGITVSA